MNPPTYLSSAAAVQRLLGCLQGRPGRSLIGLAGPPGAGKSTLAKNWAAEVNAAVGPSTMVALGMDGFHQTRKLLMARPDAAEALARRGAPWTFDPEALAARLIRLREAKGTEPVPWPDFEHAVGDPVENAIWVPAVARIVLVEGLYLLHPADGWDAVNSQFDEVWYLDTPLEVALERLTLRHMAAWNLSREQAEARVAANDRLNAEMVATGRDRAQILIRD